IVCSDIPPFREIGNDNVCYFSLQETPETIAGKIIHFVENLRPHKMYQRVKNNYVWDNIYHKTLMPTLEKIMKC
ncbi:MAG: glycosyl transferase family 1, partial [Proteobacteria bacterium]|nr:glycosyl transferase family 1 [Pseudomonadota bacterium]